MLKFLLMVGVLMVLGGVGGIETSTNVFNLMFNCMISVIGLATCYACVKEMFGEEV